MALNPNAMWWPDLGQEEPPPRCHECGEEREGDDRVLAGMKCRFCAYGIYFSPNLAPMEEENHVE